MQLNPSAPARALSLDHAWAAGGTRRCVLPPAPTSTTSSVVASVNSIRRLATTNATGIPNLSSMLRAAAE